MSPLGRHPLSNPYNSQVAAIRFATAVSKGLFLSPVDPALSVTDGVGAVVSLADQHDYRVALREASLWEIAEESS